MLSPGNERYYGLENQEEEKEEEEEEKEEEEEEKEEEEEEKKKSEAKINLLAFYSFEVEIYGEPRNLATAKNSQWVR
ncbi:hypothetical protein G9A89_019265 [Geosiphon pyriformis]|nr:hypothetical protein G9A89_019265 [Geosiphon pyriformis]